jgi:deazaflavin-dependent oxidoreductase (nitroreductase family)
VNPTRPRRRKLNVVERRLEDFIRSRPGSWFYIHVATPLDRILLGRSRGRVHVTVGQQVGLLETIGARSGEPRTTPLLYLRDGGRVVLIASKGGAPQHPGWLHNLRADPRVRFTAPGGLTGEYVAREAEGEERERLWNEAVDYYAGYATYGERAGSRVIPVVVLEPTSP